MRVERFVYYGWRYASLGDRIISAGLPLAGQRVTLRLDSPVVHVLAGGVLARTLACPVPPEARPRLRGARPGTAQPPWLPEPLVVARRVSARGSVMIRGQRIQVGLGHAGKTAQGLQLRPEPGSGRRLVNWSRSWLPPVKIGW